MFGVEAAGFHIDDDWQEATEPIGHAWRGAVADYFHPQSISVRGCEPW